MIDRHCVGCGCQLQNIDPNALGYVVKESQSLCQRCFRVRHYGDTQAFKKDGVNSTEVLATISKLEGMILLVMDISDLESGLFTGLRRHLASRSFILVVTKRDLLPITVSDEKILSVLRRRIDEEKIDVEMALLVSIKDEVSIENLRAHLRLLDPSVPLIACGYANAGKSSLLNALIKEKDALTVSPYPHTTLQVNQINFEEHVIYDTPGIKVESSFLDLIELEEVPKYTLQKSVKPMTIQLKGRQCFILDQFADLVLECEAGASITFYFTDTLNIHRTKAENRLRYIQDHHVYDQKTNHTLHFNPIYSPVDVVFKQLGWVCIHGRVKHLEVTTRIKEAILIRKAMI